MDTAKILFYRNLLFRCFFVGVGIAIILIVGTIALRDTWMPLVAGAFKVEDAEVSEQVLGSLLNIRLILLFGFLAPAVAFHWMAKGPSLRQAQGSARTSGTLLP
jgi:hypothetical protein